MQQAIQAIHCFVSGRVQGVCFRAATRQFARGLGLRGRVRNLPDGRVEVRAAGTSEQLDTLRDWLGRGPDQARVDKVECTRSPVAFPIGRPDQARVEKVVCTPVDVVEWGDFQIEETPNTSSMEESARGE